MRKKLTNSAMSNVYDFVLPDLKKVCPWQVKTNPHFDNACECSILSSIARRLIFVRCRVLGMDRQIWFFPRCQTTAFHSLFNGAASVLCLPIYGSRRTPCLL